MSQAILLESFPPRQRGLAMAIFAMGAVLGPILGPLLGGYITDNYTWRWIFYINIPLGLVALGMIWTNVFDPPDMARHRQGERIDYMGLVLLTVGLGCLQVVLDKGQQEDWFSSTPIGVLAIVSVSSLVTFVVWELYEKNPVVDLRIFKDRSFAAGNVVMFFGFFAFFGSIVLLPMYLQSLMGYTAFLAGVVLGPGGLIMLVFLPMVGKLTEKIDARFLLLVGLCISAYSLRSMAGFTLAIDLNTAIMARNVQAIGIAFFFVPLSYLTMAYVPRPSMNNASAIFNLLRNLGGSCGVAFITTLLARRAQFHQYRLVENLSPFDPGYALTCQQLKSYFTYTLGAFAQTGNMADATIARELVLQATTNAFLDVFNAQAVMFLGLCAVMWIIRRPEHGAKTGGGGH